MGGDSRTPAEASTSLNGESWWSRLLDRMGLRGASIREDIEDALAQRPQDADLSAKEQAMLRNVLALREQRVADVMVPRADIVAIPAEASLAEVLALFRTANHSRLPVYGETLDDPRGMVHIRDFLDFIAARAAPARRERRKAETPPPGPSLGAVDLSLPLSSAKILRPVLYAPPSMPALDLLARMQATRTHMALVIDEYGGTDGLASIEDIVEMIVGDIEDEHDLDEAPMVTPAADGTFLADARVGLEDVSTAIGIDLTRVEIAEDVETLAGLIVTLAGRVPARGELIAGPENLEFEVLDADPRRVKRLRIHRRAASDADAGEPEAGTEDGASGRAQRA